MGAETDMSGYMNVSPVFGWVIIKGCSEVYRPY
jgi:hypothetical protein